MAPCLTPADETAAAACVAVGIVAAACAPEGRPGEFLGNSCPCSKVMCFTSSLFRSSNSIIRRSLDSHL